MAREVWRQAEVAAKGQITHYSDSTHLHCFLQFFAAITHERIPILHRPWNREQNLYSLRLESLELEIVS